MAEFSEIHAIFCGNQRRKSLPNRGICHQHVGDRWSGPNQFIGQSLAFLDAVERASRAAPLNRPVLVIGERGTGKELIAERLHHLSPRWAGPLVVMNCAALPENLIEAELFGHEAGSFTGAAKTRHGRFEEADGGTLFLDELGTLSMPAQDRLLRAVEYGEITRIGASQADLGRRPHRRRDQRESARAGRQGPVPRRPARPPVVRGRHPAAAALARRATFRCSPSISAGAWRSSSTGRTGRASAPRAMAELEAYHWPGNVRELRNVVERAVYRHEDPERPIDEIQFDPVPLAVGAARRSAQATQRRRGQPTRRAAADAERRATAPVRLRPAISGGGRGL